MNTNNFAYLPIASRYYTGDQEGAHYSNAGEGDATTATKAAVMNAALDLGASSSVFDVTPVCLTGNCTWPPYQSLAICSTCNDLSSQLVGVPVELLQPGSNNTYPVTNWTLPNGLYLMVEESRSELGFLQ
jgi:hypothetical protein